VLHYLKNTFIWSLLVLLGGFVANLAMSRGDFSLDREVLRKAEVRYGKAAHDRLIAWEELIRQDRSSNDLDKLKKANHFFNSRIRFANDYDVWGVQDYWATPIEFICKGAGDCEDFAIAKYFTLKAMGLPDERLKITYVKAVQQNMHHMVLTYYSDPEAEPLVLDNLVDSINPASKRTDLVPIFSFNGSGLWMAKQRGQGKMAGSANRIRLWQDLLQKMAENSV
jgi:predicted transglutaminase-like cysteine proteinase